MKKVARICVLALVVAQPVRADDAAWSINGRALSCPESVRSTEPFSVTVAPDAGRELAVRRAVDGVWFFLVVASPPERQKNLLAPEALGRGGQVHIPAGLHWTSWATDAKPERVFRPGAYEIYLSENLESELGGYTCGFTVTGLIPDHTQADVAPRPSLAGRLRYS
jgi:hypothetical protein